MKEQSHETLDYPDSHPTPPATASPQPRSRLKAITQSAHSIAAFILGILSFGCYGPSFGIPAIVIGLIKLQHIRQRPSSAGGRAFALSGAILGGTGLALSLLFFIVHDVPVSNSILSTIASLLSDSNSQ
jgi:hypothetical protein